jgi:hypothetical protein
MASENTAPLVQSVTQTPSPPSFEEIYRQSIGQGLTAVFAQWDAQFKSWQDKLSQAKELSQPLVPGGGSPLMTPRQRQALTQASGSEHRLGWTRLIYNAGRVVNGNSGGWPIGVAYSGGTSFVVIGYSIPPVAGLPALPADPFTAPAARDLSLWPIPENRKSDIMVYNPHLNVSLLPVAGFSPIFDATMRVRSFVRTSSVSAGRTSYHWSFSCWLEDKDGVIVPIQSVYAELL